LDADFVVIKAVLESSSRASSDFVAMEAPQGVLFDNIGARAGSGVRDPSDNDELGVEMRTGVPYRGIPHRRSP